MQENGEAMPGALVRVYQEDMRREHCVSSAYTNRNGTCQDMELDAPGIALSQIQDTHRRPYALYHVEVSKDGHDIEEIRNIQVFPEEGSTLYVQLRPSQDGYQKRNVISLGDHKLYENVVKRNA